MRSVRLCSLILAAGTLVAQRGPAPGRPADVRPDVSFPGNAARGQAIFEGAGGCLKCHRVKENGSRLGPDLTDFGTARLTAEEVKRLILEPDADVLPQNRSYRVVTRDGAVITGKLLNHDTFNVQLIDTKEQLLTFQKANLREHGFVKNFTMPSYKDKLPPEDVTDLVAYLASLKGITKQ